MPYVKNTKNTVVNSGGKKKGSITNAKWPSWLLLFFRTLTSPVVVTARQVNDDVVGQVRCGAVAVVLVFASQINGCSG